MQNKTAAVSLAIIGASVAASYINAKLMERDIKKRLAKMAQDRVELDESIRNLGK